MISMAQPSESGAPGRSSVPSGLLTVLLIALVPIILVHHLGLPMNFMLLVAAAYVVQLAVLIFVFVVRERAAVPPRWALLALLYGISQGVTLWLAIWRQGEYASEDLIALIAKVLGVVFLAGATSTVHLSPSSLGRFLRGILCVTAVAATYNLVANWSSFSTTTLVSSSYQLDYRGFFANRNQFGHFLFLSLLTHLLYLQTRRWRLWNYALMVLQALSLLLTMSRGSLAAVIVMLTMLIAVRYRRRPNVMTFTVFASLTIVIAGYALLPAEPFNATVDLIVRPDAGLAGRGTLWSAGLAVWSATSLIFGTGSFLGVTLAQDAGMVHSEFHNFFVETLVSGGLIELTLILSVILAVARRLWKSVAPDEIKQVYFSGYLGLLFIVAFESVSFFTVGFVGTIYTIFFVSLPLILAASHPRPSSSAVNSIDSPRSKV